MDLDRDLDIDMDININMDINMYLFYKKYPLFDINEYRKINKCNIHELEYYDNNQIIEHYHSYGYPNNLISSKKHFYNTYPEFNFTFYKIINKHLYCSNNELDYIINYINFPCKKIYSINHFIELYNADFNFIRIFYQYFSEKSDFDIIKIIYPKIEEYILSEYDFDSKYPEFNKEIYSTFTEVEINDCKKVWYHNEKKDVIYSIGSFYNKYPSFNIKLYIHIYNLLPDVQTNIIHFLKLSNGNNGIIIYSEQIFKDYIDDINYILMVKHYKLLSKFNKEKIIDFYLENIYKIKDIYSEKLFYIMYPLFDIDEYIKFNNITKYSHTTNNNLILYNEYHNNHNKNNIIISIKDFHNKNPKIDINIYKKIININNIYFDDDKEYIYYIHKNKDTVNIESYINSFKKKYNDFNIKIYKYFQSDSEYIKKLDLSDVEVMIDFDIKTKNQNDINNKNIIYSLKTFYKNYKKLDIDFDIDIYKTYNDLNTLYDEDLIVNFCEITDKSQLVYNINSALKYLNNFNIDLYKELNKDISHLSNKDLLIHWYKFGKYENRIYSIETFYEQYPNLDFNISENHINAIIEWMNIGIYKYIKETNDEKDYTIIGRNVVNNIYEVLLDFDNSYNRELIKPGISLIIRAKNEELNIKYCIESVADLVDEIIFVDNNSTDNTYNLVKEYQKIYDNIRLYKYNIIIPKVGIEHKNAIEIKSKNTLGSFYNWCLSKSTRYNVFKWDADFICIRNNFKQLVNKFNLRERNDKFAIWFTGKTIFENNDNFYLNNKSFYNEYRIFSYKNGFCWYDGNTCEYTDPYLEKCKYKYRYEYPLFYEIKRTSLDEFKERSSLIDSRDINDNRILNSLKNIEYDNKECSKELILINKNIINKNINIIIYTPSLTFGGGNQFIINIYTYYKIFGFNVIIIPANYQENLKKNDKFNMIVEDDIIQYSMFNLQFIKLFSPYCIFFNSDLPFKDNDIKEISKITKIMFVTHSDVAFSNSFVQKYHQYMEKIITVNNYTIRKLSKQINIDFKKFYKIINFCDINKDNLIVKHNKKFGVISRFSEDKNIPMLLYALKDVFKKYSNYKCYLVGTYNEKYDNYLKNLSIELNIENNVVFEGYQENVTKYYEMFDFIVLPSVSEGCSYNIIEAMSLGLPVVTSDVGGNHELIKNNVNGILYEYEGIKEYESKTIFITNYNEQLLRLGYKTNNNLIQTPFNTNDYNLINRFKKNMNKISESIIKMIQLYNDMNNIEKIKENNIKFIEDKFNESFYINQLFDLIFTNQVI